MHSVFPVNLTSLIARENNFSIDLSDGTYSALLTTKDVVPEYVSTLREFYTNSVYIDLTAFSKKVITNYNEGMEPKWLSVYIDGTLGRKR